MNNRGDQLFETLLNSDCSNFRCNLINNYIVEKNLRNGALSFAGLVSNVSKHHPVEIKRKLLFIE